MSVQINWYTLSKGRKNAGLILFHKIINNLEQVPHVHILAEAYDVLGRKTTTGLGTWGEC